MLRVSEEIELQRPVHRFLERTTVPIIGAAGALEGRLFVYVDVTARRELDRQRSDFLTVAAHELRTPLTPLSMYLQNMERRLARGQPIDHDLAGKARRQVSRLAKLVEDLLDVSRVEAGRLQLARELFDLQSIADHVVSDFRSSTQVHEIVLRRPAAPLPVWGDRQRLEQVFVNLLQNAVKYSPQGGKVTVELGRDGDAARVSVTDEGIGIPVEDQANLFQRFFRAKNATTRNFAGLGIGLFVSHEIVGQHGGTFAVRSEPGRGSTFTFGLPLAETAARASQAQKRVLLVDDDPEILGATGELLREWGYVVDEARDGATGLQLARAARPDIMLVDLMMPTMDGWTFIERLRREHIAPGVPVIVFSADRDARDKAAALQADAALRKPFDLDELHALLERLVPGRETAAHP
jgi:signal transduction histidine kinase/CheY-like chemotaxis protein